eukprot:scaffold85555_cov38-Prasinocladus_malaysianus.AAC.1
MSMNCSALYVLLSKTATKASGEVHATFRGAVRAGWGISGYCLDSVSIWMFGWLLVRMVQTDRVAVVTMGNIITVPTEK